MLFLLYTRLFKMFGILWHFFYITYYNTLGFDSPCLFFFNFLPQNCITCVVILQYMYGNIMIPVFENYDIMYWNIILHLGNKLPTHLIKSSKINFLQCGFGLFYLAVLTKVLCSNLLCKKNVWIKLLWAL